METATKFGKIMALTEAEKIATGQYVNVHYDLYSYFTSKCCWAIVVFNVVNGKLDIGKELYLLKEAERRWRTNTNRLTLIYEYNETDNIFKMPQHITVHDDILHCSEDLVKHAKKIVDTSPRDWLKKTEDSSPFQVNTEPKSMRKRSLQVQFLEGLRAEERKMSAVVFTDLTKGVASLIALLNLLYSDTLPADSAAVKAFFYTDANVEQVKLGTPIIETRYGKTVLHKGSCIIECQTSLSKYLNIFIPFLKAKEKDEDYTLCGFKLIDMCLGDISNLNRLEECAICGMTEEIYRSQGKPSWSWRYPEEPFKGQRWCQACFVNCNTYGTSKRWNPKYTSVEEFKATASVKKRMEAVDIVAKGPLLESDLDSSERKTTKQRVWMSA
jgi:hypothetical protein